MSSVGAPVAAISSFPISARASSTPASTPGAAYHYKKNSSSPSPSPSSNTQLSQRHNSRQEATQAVTTIGKAHKPNFSLGAFLGGAPHSSLGGYRPSAKQVDPSRNLGGVREQFGGGQSPQTDPILGGRSNIASTTTAKLRALEATDQTGKIRSTSSLKIKMPSLKMIGRSNSTLGNKQAELPRNSSLRPLSPFSLRSPILEGRTPGPKRALTIDPVGLERPRPGSPYLSPSHTRVSEEAPMSLLGSPQFSAASTASSADESLPLTPKTVRSGSSLPRSPVAPEPRLLQPQSEGDLCYRGFLRDDMVTSTVIEYNSAEFLKPGTRPFPTTTQDDLSLERHHLAQKHNTDNRISRRASVSVTSMLSSTSSTHSRPTSRSGSGGADNHSCFHQHQRPVPTSLVLPKVGLPDNQHRSPLSPMTFETSPELDLDLPTPRLPPPPPSSSSSHLPDEDDSAVPTPIATSMPDVPFGTFIIPAPQYPHDDTVYSSSPSRSVSRTGSSEMGDSRNSSSDTGHSRSSRSPQRRKTSPGQQAQWERERERVTEDMLDAYEGEACLIRFEPKQGWIGFWNRSDVEKVIDGLRELRSPKP